MASDPWVRADDCRLDDLFAVVGEVTDPQRYPLATEVIAGVLVYDCDGLVPALAEPVMRRRLQGELVDALADGPGVVVLRGAFGDLDVVDGVTAAFADIIAEEKARGGPAGDHFGRPGANDRIWNALEKLALRDPELFVRYYSNDPIALVSEAWLGPAYQITSQVNVVNPGGVAQAVHRDYHLGFQSDEVAERYPAHTHALSPALTLQGAVAHTDMPVESGPTQLLPHSQKYPAGYVAWRRPDVRQFFEANYVQLPLRRGDAVFFNPALFHAAGDNHTADVHRMANLLQVSSAFGRAMETVDRRRVSLAVYETLAARVADGWDPRLVANAVAASAEGYAFPTNLDRDQPIGGLAPPSQADLVTRALHEGWGTSRLREELDALVERQSAG